MKNFSMALEKKNSMKNSPANRTDHNGNGSHENTELNTKTDLKMENKSNMDENSSIATSVNEPEKFPSGASFSTRHTASCVFSYVDDRCQLMGYLPTNMIGQSIFDFYHTKDVQLLKDVFEIVVKKPGSIIRSNPYRFKIQNGCYIMLESEWCCFINPWSHNVEFVMGEHRVLRGCSDADIFFPPQNEIYFQKDGVKESKTDEIEIENLLSEEKGTSPNKKNQQILKNMNDAVENQNMSDSMESESQSDQSSSLTRRSSFESANSKEEEMDCGKDVTPLMNTSNAVELPLKNTRSYKLAVSNMEDTLRKDMEFLNLTSQPEFVIKQFQMLKDEQEEEKKLNIGEEDVVLSQIKEEDIQDINLYLPTENKVKKDSSDGMHDVSPVEEVNGSSSSSDIPVTMQQMWLEENIDRFFASDPKTCCGESDESNKNEKFYQQSPTTIDRSKNVSGSRSTSKHQQASPSNSKNNIQASIFSFDSGYEKSAENDVNPGTSYEGSVAQTWLPSSPNNSDEKLSPFQPLTKQSLFAQNRMNHDQFKQRKHKLHLDKTTLKSSCSQPTSKHGEGLHKRSLMKSTNTQTNNEIPVVYKGTLEYSGYTQLTFPEFINDANLSQTNCDQNVCTPSTALTAKNTGTLINQTREQSPNEMNERVEDSSVTDENQSPQNTSDSMESEDQGKSPSLSRKSSFQSTSKNDEDMDSEKDNPSTESNSNKLKLPFEIAFRYQMTVPSIKDILEKDKEVLKSVVQPELVLQQLRVLQKEFENEKKCKLNVRNEDFNVTHDIKLHLPSENRPNNGSNNGMHDTSPLNDVNCSSSSSDAPPTMQQMWLEENIDRFFASDPKTCCYESNESSSNEKFYQHSPDSYSVSTNASGSTSSSECRKMSSSNFKNKTLQTNLLQFGKNTENNSQPGTSHEGSSMKRNLHSGSLSSTNSSDQCQFKQQGKKFSLGKRSLEDDCQELQSLAKRKKQVCKQTLMRSQTTQTINEIPVVYKGTLEYSGCTQLTFPKLIFNENQEFGCQNFSPSSSTSAEENAEYSTCKTRVKCPDRKTENVAKNTDGSIQNKSLQNMSDSVENELKAEKSAFLTRSSLLQLADNKDEEMDCEKDNPKNRSNKVELPFEIAFRYQMAIPSMEDTLQKDKAILKNMVQPELVLQQLLMLQKEQESENNCKLNATHSEEDLAHNLLRPPTENKANNDNLLPDGLISN